MGYKEIKKEKKAWNEKATKIKDEARLRGAKDVATLKKQLIKVHKFLDGRARKGLLLDVGCGNAQFTVNVANLFDFVVGLDISAEMMMRYKEKPGNLCFVLASATDLPFKSNTFDSIMSISTLQHIKPKINVEKTLLEMSKCSKSNSFIFLTFWNTPNSPASTVKLILTHDGYKLRQSLISKLRLTRYVKLWGYKSPRSRGRGVSVKVE